jgi:hypothetical protein
MLICFSLPSLQQLLCPGSKLHNPCLRSASTPPRSQPSPDRHGTRTIREAYHSVCTCRLAGYRLTGFRDRFTSLGLFQPASSPSAAHNLASLRTTGCVAGLHWHKAMLMNSPYTKPRNACHIPPLHCVAIAPFGRFTSYPSQWCSQPLPFLQRLVRLATLPCSGAGYSPARLRLLFSCRHFYLMTA